LWTFQHKQNREPPIASQVIRRIYLDYNASTPLAPEVAALMREVMDSAFGNPSSLHWAGAPAREIVEHARGKAADLLGCAAEEGVFTSGGFGYRIVLNGHPQRRLPNTLNVSFSLEWSELTFWRHWMELRRLRVQHVTPDAWNYRRFSRQ
jgi:cysteine sulfinate desulfinase/cysteine desulfurase-like protein